MGNHKFKLSDMIPNAWFYKLRDLNRVKNQHKATQTNQSSNHPHLSKITNQPHLTCQRKSYHFSRDLTDDLQPNSQIKKSNIDKIFPIEPPRKSSRRRRSTKRNRLVSSSISAACSCGNIDSLWNKPPQYSTPEEYTNSRSPDQTSSSEFDPDRDIRPDSFDEMFSWSRKCECNFQNDIVIELDSVPELAPIITKKQNDQKTYQSLSVSNQSYEKINLSRSCQQDSLSVKVVKENVLLSTTTKTRRFSGNSSSPGLKLRTNSPRISNKRIQGCRKSVSSNSSSGSRRRVSESFAVVKSSKNPGRDFRESMEEMIVENNIRASKDLEELLACYLSLNSDEYHDLIIHVFKQIWCDSVSVHLK